MNKFITPLSALLSSFFQALEKENMAYCVCGNYEKLPEFTTHDVDIWAADVKKAERILYKSAYKQKFKLYLIYKTGVGSNNFFYRYEADNSISLVRIDLMRECAWKSVFTLVPGEIIKNKRRKFRNFYIPDFSVEAGMQLLYPLISGKRVKDKYKELIFAARNYSLFIEILNNSLGQRYAGWLINQIGDKKWCEIEKNVIQLRIEVIRQNILNYFNARKALMGIKSFIYYIRKYIKPGGIFIAFIGADGCGKSTLCKKIPKILKAGLMPMNKTFYWRPMLLPRIQKLLSPLGIKSRPENISTAGLSHGKPNSYLSSVIKFVYYWLDFLFGSLKFYHVLAKGGIVCFDRYYHDFFVNPERFRLKLPFWLIKTFASMIPRPNLVFYLHTRPEVLISRKNEVSLQQLRRQNNAYLRVASSLPNAHVIDANQSLDEVVREVNIIILNFMRQRINKVYYENN